MSPKYFTRPECPDRTFFVCDRLHGEVSVEWCAKTWADVNNGARSKRWGSECQTISDRTCRRCPLGAQHAGVEFVPSAVVIDSKVCPRCRRPAERLIHGRLCVSCYNRDRERKIGRNAKGAKPKYLPAVHGVEIFARVKQGKPVLRKELCVDGVEGLIATFRALGSLAAIGFHAKPVRAQSDLFVRGFVMAWEIEDHLCRRCLGRVLSHRDSRGVVSYRCSNCGLEGTGTVQSVCCCGVKVAGKRDAGLRCVKNSHQDAEFPGEVVAVPTGG